MFSDSLGQVLGVAQGSMTNVGGSIGDFLGNGIGSLGETLGPLLDSLNVASGAAEVA